MIGLRPVLYSHRCMRVSSSPSVSRQLFQIKSEAASLPSIGPILLHELTFSTLHSSRRIRPRVAPLLSGLSPILSQPIPTKALGKGLRVFRLGKAEYHEVAVIVAQGICNRRR